MKYLKMLGLAVFAAALTIGAGTASATTLTSPKGTVYTGKLKAETAALTLEGPFVTIECDSALEGPVEQHGEAVTTLINLTSVSFTNCNFNSTVSSMGTLEIHTDNSEEDGNGTVTWTGLNLTLHTSVGQCVFTTMHTSVGTISGSDTSSAEWNVSNAKFPRTGGNFLCGSSSTLTGAYEITTPSTLSVD